MSNSNMVGYYDRYVEAWNEHDPESVMEQFADGGTLDDPATDGTLTGQEIGEWVEETAKAFPDYHFEEGRRASNEQGVLFAEWTMHGTHDGPLNGVPPTHRTIEINAVDAVILSEDGITAIRGYFDMSEVTEQLGLTFPTVLVQLPKLAVSAVKNAI